MKKKIVAAALCAAMVSSLAACGGSSDSTTAAAAGDTTAAAAAADTTAAAAGDTQAPAAADGVVSVFYYTYGDTYISSVRAALDSALQTAGVEYQDYDSNNSQTTQAEQVDTAIAKGTSLLVVNLVDSGSDDAAKNIISKAEAAGIPVVFFNRSVSEEAVSGYDKAVFVGTDYEMAGHMQGQMIGEYLVENYDAVDLNGDGSNFLRYVQGSGG